MKKILYLPLIIILLVSCGNNEKEETKNLVLATNSFVLESGVPSVEIAIIEGNGDYVLTTSNKNVAVPYKKSDRLVIAALSAGTTTITVKDRLGLQATLNFKVAENYTPTVNETDLIYLEKGTSKALLIPPYSKKEPLISNINASIASISVKKDTLFATGSNLGVAYAWYGTPEGFLLSSHCIKVVDNYDISLISTIGNPNEEIRIGRPYEYVFVIKSGGGGYTYELTGANIFDAVDIRSYVWTDSVIEPQLSNPAYLHVKTKVLGDRDPTQATIRIKDRNSHVTGKYTDLKLNSYYVLILPEQK